jgi:ParB/RepB/Spo0J family partition protein
MAKNFAKSNGTKVIDTVAKQSNEKANIVTVKMISNDRLHDYPKNNENISYTEDIEISIQQMGFTDPIEVTDFGMEDGEYTILSGHRRRAAAVKQKIETFPCIVRHFTSDLDVYNYVLLSNDHRNPENDPLLYARRYKMHEEYLVDAGFTGSLREEIAKRLGMSVQNADRYKQFTKIILPVWDMVQAEKVGMSSVLPMASHPVAEQEEILSVLNECLESGGKLTREMCDKIIKGYRDGKKSFNQIISDIQEQREITPSLPPLNESHPAENDQNDDSKQRSDNEPDKPKGTNIIPINSNQQQAAGSSEKKEKKPPLSDEEKKKQRALDIEKHLKGLEENLNDYYVFDSAESAELCMKSMGGVLRMALDEMYEMSRVYKKPDTFTKIIKDFEMSIKQYNK